MKRALTRPHKENGGVGYSSGRVKDNQNSPKGVKELTLRELITFYLQSKLIISFDECDRILFCFVWFGKGLKTIGICA